MIVTNGDEYQTLAAPAQCLMRERSSKFLAFAYPVNDEQQVAQRLAALRKEYYDATHHCYAWRLGFEGERSRVNDDGEPSGTAGRPILGQLLSAEVTDTLVVVVRYFGGTKLGTSGLIAAYRQATADVLASANVVVRTKNARFSIEFPYLAMNDVMRVVKDMNPRIEQQNFENLCRMHVNIRCNLETIFAERLSKIEGVRCEQLDYN